MEIKVSTALETALEFISEVATCKVEELETNIDLGISFIDSLIEVLSFIEVQLLKNTLYSVSSTRRKIQLYKEIEG